MKAISLIVQAFIFSFLFSTHVYSKGESIASSNNSNIGTNNTKAVYLALKKKSKKNHQCYKDSNPVCQGIMLLKPQINLDEAYKLSNIFVRVAKKYQLPVQLLLSIAKQESNFQVGAVRKVRGFSIDGDQHSEEYTAVGTDYCMMQINARNIRKLEFKSSRLVKDAEYCLEAGAKILLWAKKFQKKDPSWWSRYNAVSDIHRQIYQKHVLKHWRKLDPQVDQEVCEVGSQSC